MKTYKNHPEYDCTVIARVNKERKNLFKKMYPYTLTDYVRRAINAAIQNKEIFKMIYLGDYDK